jgi:hypothetical protein
MHAYTDCDLPHMFTHVPYTVVCTYRSFLDSQGGLAVLYMHTYIINRKLCPLELALQSTADNDSNTNSDSIDVLMPQAATSFLSEITARETGEVYLSYTILYYTYYIYTITILVYRSMHCDCFIVSIWYHMSYCCVHTSL